MKRRVLHLLSLSIFFILSSCAGYHFNTSNNPLIGYDIKSVAVPMFINRSNIAGLSPMMTKEIILTLNEYSGLRVYGGDNQSADAVLVGILESEDLKNKTFKTTETVFTDDKLKESIGNRTPFYIPIETSYKFTMRIFLIKRPTAQELELLASELGKNIVRNPKIVLREVLDVTSSFSRVVADNTSSSSGGEVNFVKNKGVLNKSLEDACVSAASNFKQVVLNAF
jgi:hypothetical protein